MLCAIFFSDEGIAFYMPVKRVEVLLESTRDVVLKTIINYQKCLPVDGSYVSDNHDNALAHTSALVTEFKQMKI